MDVIASSQNDDKIAWYENLTILGVVENESSFIKVYPNPVKDILNIEQKSGTTVLSATLYDVYGRKLNDKEAEVSQINFNNYPSGVYYLWVEANPGGQVFKVIKE